MGRRLGVNGLLPVQILAHLSRHSASVHGPANSTVRVRKQYVVELFRCAAACGLQVHGAGGVRQTATGVPRCQDEAGLLTVQADQSARGRVKQSRASGQLRASHKWLVALRLVRHGAISLAIIPTLMERQLGDGFGQ